MNWTRRVAVESRADMKAHGRIQALVPFSVEQASSEAELWWGNQRIGLSSRLPVQISGGHVEVAIPFAAAMVWNELQSKASKRSFSVKCGEGAVDLVIDEATVVDLSLGLENLCPGYSLQDAYFSTEAELQLRFAVSGDSSRPRGSVELVCLQVANDVETQVREVRIPIPTDDTFVLAVPLVNPLMPLLVLTAVDGELVGTALVPFPSLCRGGLHCAEQVALSNSDDYIADLAELWRDLTSNLLRRRVARLPSIRLIASLSNASGSERLLSRFFIEWLTLNMEVDLTLEPGEDGVSAWPADFLSPSAITRSSLDADDAASLVLEVPIDSIPTISLLVDSETSVQSGKLVCPHFLVASSQTYKPEWEVRLPAGHLEATRKYSAIATYPVVRQPAAVDLADVMQDIGFPSVIRFPAARSVADLRMLYWPAQAAPSAQCPQIPLNCIVVGMAEQAAATQSSLENQLGVDVSIDIVDCQSGVAGQARGMAGLHSVARQINVLAARVAGAPIVLASSGTVLQDPRALALMANILSTPGIGTVGCMLVTGAPGNGIALHSAGIFPESAGFFSPAAAYVCEPRHGFPLWGSAFPVVANRLELLMVKPSVWAQVGGLPDNLPSRTSLDLEFALKVRAANHANFCTTLTSASVPRLPNLNARLHAPGLRRLVTAGRLLTGTTVLRRL